MRVWGGRLPGLGLGVSGVEVGKEGSGGEMLEVGGVIGHTVEGAREIVVEHDITMRALVEGLSMKEVRGGFGGCDTTFALPEEGGGVISETPEGAFADIETLGRAVMVNECCGQFQVGVGDGAMGV